MVCAPEDYSRSGTNNNSHRLPYNEDPNSAEGYNPNMNQEIVTTRTVRRQMTPGPQTVQQQSGNVYYDQNGQPFVDNGARGGWVNGQWEEYLVVDGHPTSPDFVGRQNQAMVPTNPAYQEIDYGTTVTRVVRQPNQVMMMNQPSQQIQYLSNDGRMVPANTVYQEIGLNGNVVGPPVQQGYVTMPHSPMNQQMAYSTANADYGMHIAGGMPTTLTSYGPMSQAGYLAQDGTHTGGTFVEGMPTTVYSENVEYIDGGQYHTMNGYPPNGGYQGPFQ